MAQYIVKEFNNYKKFLKYSLCADEIVVQTIAMSSPYKDSIVDSSCRCIDWERGKPYIFQIEDYDFLYSSKAMFARKFASDIDNQIINRIKDNVKVTMGK